MPKSHFWKFDSSNGTEPWMSRGISEEKRKIRFMAKDELIEYVKEILLSPPEASDISKLFESLWNYTVEDPRSGYIYGADDIFVLEMTDVFIDVRSRLKRINVDNAYDPTDFENVETVMGGNISSSNYTAIFLVHQHMTKKQLPITKKQNEIKKYRRDFQDFWDRFEACIGRKLGYYTINPIN